MDSSITKLNRKGRKLAMAKRREYKKRNRIRTNAMKAKIDKTQAESTCRLCDKVDETVGHIVCQHPMLVQRNYKRRHD